MNLAIASVRTLVAVTCTAALVGCVDGDDIKGAGGEGGPLPANMRAFELYYEGQKLSWTPIEGEAYQGLSGSVDGDVFQIDTVLLSLGKTDGAGILRDDGSAGIIWSAPGGVLSTGERSCDAGEIVMAIRFPHEGHLVTHVNAVNGGKPAMSSPVTEGVSCSINITKADKVGGFVEGTIDATLAFVAFSVAPGNAEAADLKQLTGKFRLTRAPNVVAE